MAPAPLRVRPVWLAPSAMTPLKVVEPPVGARVSVAAWRPLLVTVPPPPGPLSDSEATVWGVPLRSNTAPAEICTGLALGKLPTLLKYSCVTWAWVSAEPKSENSSIAPLKVFWL